MAGRQEKRVNAFMANPDPKKGYAASEARFRPIQRVLRDPGPPKEAPKSLTSKALNCFAGFSTDPAKVNRIEELISCVRCNKIPNPIYYMSCDKCGRLQCGACAYSFDQIMGDTEDQICCKVDILSKGPERVLRALVEKSYWECPECNEEIKGWEWEDHMKDCSYSGDATPRFRN